MGTTEAVVCQQGLFHERIPCTAGSGSCRKGTGRCALDNICCSQGNLFIVWHSRFSLSITPKQVVVGDQ
nr:unnamed protein product [Callosobruchus chinensis]